MKAVREVFEFDWDKGNTKKNQKHNVADKEAEEVFFDENKFIYKDKLHSKHEERFVVLGMTEKDRLLYVVFTKRGKKVRIISARNINKKEVELYEKAT